MIWYLMPSIVTVGSSAVRVAAVMAGWLGGGGKGDGLPG
jgi:hypothetical protein